MEKLLNNVLTENSFKSKLNTVKEFECTFSIVQKPSMNTILWKRFEIF